MANDFTAVGAPTFSAGKFGNALTPSAGNYLTFTNASAFASSTGLTVEYWIKTSSSGSFEGVFCRAGNEWFGVTGGKLFCSATWIVDVSVNDGVWHHVAWTFDGSTAKCWLDGVQRHSVASGLTSFFWSASGDGSRLLIGARTDAANGTGVNSPFVGQIDDLRISKVVRYTSTFTPPTNTHTGDSNTLGLYRFESSGIDSAADTTPPAASPVPTIPTNVNATASAGQVSLTWTASTDDVAVTGYRIYRRGTLVGTSVGTSFTETGLPGGIRYEYRVTAIDAAGNESDLSAIAGAATPDALKPGAALVIFDADMSSDIDDIGALATLHALADLGEVKILGMGVSSTNGGTVEAMDVVNTYYGRPDIPVGARAGITGPGGYPGTIASEFPHDLVWTAAPAAVTVYRQILAAAANNSITIVSCGYLTNLSTLLNSPADGISGLTGSQLIAAKVKTWVPMGGMYPSGNEFNFMSAGDGGAAAFHVVNNWPAAVTYSGFEIGSPIWTGGDSLINGTPATNPVRRAWQVFHDPVARSSWDQTAVYAAVRSAEGLFGSTNVGRNSANSDGSNFWTLSPDPSGLQDQAYLLEKVRYPVQNVIDLLMRANPAAVGPLAPTPPTNLRAISVTSSSIVLAWTSNSYNETGFQVERRDNGVWAQVGTTGAGITTFTNSGLSSTANRAYRVRANNAKGSSAYATLTVYSGWTDTNFANPANVPLYTVYQDHLRYARALAEDHVTINNDSTHGTTLTITTDVAAVGQEGSLCVYFLYQDANNWYRLNVADGACKFEKRVSGTVSQVGSAAGGISIGPGTKLQPWTVTLTPTAMSFASPTVSLNVNETFNFASGKAGFGGQGRGGIWQNVSFAGSSEVAATPALTNSVLPTVSGLVQVGQTLAASTGTWNVTPDAYAYQWRRNGLPISGATASTYLLTSTDLGATISVAVSVIKTGYTPATAVSASTGTVAAVASGFVGETFDPVTLQNDTGQKLNAAYFNRLESNLETFDDRTAALQLGIATPITLVASGGAITPDASVGALFRHTATADVVLNAPVNGTDGQLIAVEVIASGASRILSFAGGGVDAVTLSVGQRWTGQLRRNAGSDEWILIDGGGGSSSGGTSGAPTANPTFTGTVTAPRYITPPVTVTYASTITLNATQSSAFRCTATGNLTLTDITGGVDGQQVVLEVIASGGARTVSFTGGATSVTIPSGARWSGMFRYSSSGDTWYFRDGPA